MTFSRRVRLAASASLASLVACAPAPTLTADTAEPAPASSTIVGDTATAAGATVDATAAPRQRDPPAHPAWVIIGAVTGPTMNQVSIEEEVAAVEALLGPDRGILLYAGGPATRGVLVSGRPDEAPPTDPLLVAVSDLVGFTNLVDSHYRPLVVTPHDPATPDLIRTHLAHAFGSPGDTLTVWLAGHGDQAASASEASVGTWGGGTFNAKMLDELLLADRSGRPVQLIATQCFGGGFADALIAHPERACGAFAAVWDLPASGCDPDPDAPRTSYGVHLRAALAGEVTVHDLDGNGVIGLSEAHVSAVLAVSGIDVPTLSSQYLIERAAPPDLMPADLKADASRTTDASLPAHLLEERYLVDTLLTRLGLTVATFDQAHEAASLALDAFDEEALPLAEALDSSAAEARGRLLAQWPELADAWHPDFTPTLTNHRAAITRFFDSSPEVALWLSRRAEYDEADGKRHELEVKLRALDRVDVNLETMRNASRAFENPDLLEAFLSLRQCERAPVAMRRP